MNTVICAIAKYENDYIAEWVRYHINLGFDHIYIYDNNEIDGERIEDVVPSDLKGKVSVLDVRGKKYMQKIVYNECYRTFDFDWCAFIDIDEFITFNPKSGYTNIEQFLQDRDEFDAVHLNWMCYGDNGMVRKKEGGVVDRFKKPIKPFDYKYCFDFPENNHIKTIIKSGLNIDWCCDADGWCSNPHTPMGVFKVCDEKGQLIENTPYTGYSHDIIYIRHYYSKTISEFVLKIVRQCADCNAKPYTFAKFYIANKCTVRKLFEQNRLRRKYCLRNRESSVLYTILSMFRLRYPKLFKLINQCFYR